MPLIGAGVPDMAGMLIPPRFRRRAALRTVGPVLAAFALLAVVSGQTSASAAVSQPAKLTAVSGNGAFLSRVIVLTNQQRAAHGCRPLVAERRLMLAAQLHTTDMATHNFFDHYSQNRRSPAVRVAATGYRYRTVAENIAYGQRTPEAVVAAWMASPGHRANILDCRLTQIGVGYLYNPAYVLNGRPAVTAWTQDFGLPR
jgi:uncharacterized protein YkwD